MNIINSLFKFDCLPAFEDDLAVGAMYAGFLAGNALKVAINVAKKQD